MLNKFYNKGQSGETMTWIVATIIILVMTFLFIAVTGLLAQQKKVGFSFDGWSEQESSIGTQQMLFALLQYKIGETAIQENILKESYNDVTIRPAVESVLNKFREQGNICRFTLFDVVKQGYLLQLGEVSKGTSASLVIEGKKVSLEC